MDELMAADVKIHDLCGGDGEKIFRLPVFKEIFRALRSELSEVQVTIEYELSQGDLVAARFVITASHNSDAGRKPIHFTGMTLARVRAGKIVESWNHFDFETMYQQME